MDGDASRPLAAEELGDELDELELALADDEGEAEGELELDRAPSGLAGRIAMPARRGLRGEGWPERSSRLYEELRSPARAMVRRAFRTAFGDDELDDIYSSAWLGTLRALRSREADMGDEEVRRYVMAAVANHAVKELRRRKRKPIAPLEAAGQPVDSSAGPADEAASAERSQMARDLLASLPPRRRAVMLLRYGWGLEPKQVCGLIEGLSPRAYRKEITRGVEQFTARLKKLDDGEWCEEREPILQSFVAGTASADEQIQAKAHLAHCRGCHDFVARLNGHLHDLGSAIAMPGALDALDGRISIPDRALDFAERIRDSVSGSVGRAQAAVEPTTSTAATGGTRGAGAAGAGLAAKLAGLGGAGKVASACLAGGAAATVCVAAGIAPVPFAPKADERDAAPRVAEAPPTSPPARPLRAPELLPVQIGHELPPEPQPQPQPEPEPEPQPTEPEPPPVSPEPAPTTTVAEQPVVPVETQQFDPLAPTPAAPPSNGTSSSSSSSSSGGSSGASATNQEFGP
ncbi:sigma-70 family RNA polymerase sigma factor [Thermoleophilia bacterium SCSIO 60948]|nr:sigma-70 family RNA polymerase sigma factor [Thermoleophilia bacterium SCSIO 60948]